MHGSKQHSNNSFAFVGKWQCSVNWIHTILSKKVFLFPPSNIQLILSKEKHIEDNINTVFPFRYIIENHHVLISYGGLTSLEENVLSSHEAMTRFFFIQYCTFQRDTFRLNTLSTIEENDGCDKLFNENNDHVIKV